MFNKEESINTLKKYYKKLSSACSKQNAVFSLGDNVLVLRNKVNDIICCIEAAYPKEYNDFVRYYGNLEKVQSHNIHRELAQVFANKFFLADYCYINYKKVDSLINAIVRSLNSDFNIVENHVNNQTY